MSVSTKNSERVCVAGAGGRGYCGRLSQRAFVDRPRATCADCLAAMRADDQEKIR